jgi:carboxymethylenebutenolidase
MRNGQPCFDLLAQSAALLSVVLMLAGCGSGSIGCVVGGAGRGQTASFAVPVNEKLPPGSDAAAAAIERSPRHAEWVVVPYGAATLKAWIVYPERATKAPVVLVIHTIGGLNAWARALTDQLAEDGYIGLAVDFLSGFGPNGGGTDSLAGGEEVRKAMGQLTRVEVARRLDAARAFALKIPAASGRIATMGFCWGGSRSFEYAVAQPELNAAVVFYGTSPENAADFSKIKAPVLGLYGGDDARVNATIEPAAAELKKLGKVFEYDIYEGAGHGFVGGQADRGGANYRATEKAWPRALAFLRKHLD